MNMLPFLKSFLEDIRDFSLVQVLSFFHWSKSLLYVSESGLRGGFQLYICTDQYFVPIFNLWDTGWEVFLALVQISLL